MKRRPLVSPQGHPLFEAGVAYPLKDPTRYDDDLGAGFGYALIPGDATPGECWVHDAWIVDAKGNQHPGYAESPIPILRDAVDFDRAIRLEAGPLPPVNAARALTFGG